MILTSIMTEYPYMPLRDVVFHTLRRAIMQGDLKPGERLMEIKLANRLGVSRTPIREAIRMLELEGPGDHGSQKGRPGGGDHGKGSERCAGGPHRPEELAVKLSASALTTGS